jgi:hypothetical protein
MTFERLLELTVDEPVFETGFLLAGDLDPKDVRRQLSRWAKVGRVQQLRRGLYTLAPPYRKVSPHPFVVGNRLASPSYVSLQSALAYYGIIPEYVPVVTSVTTARADAWSTPLGEFTFRHIQPSFFRGYREIELTGEQRALVAVPEKALLDIVYLEKGADSAAFLTGLRLQNLNTLDLGEMTRLIESAKSPKLSRAVRAVAALVEAEEREYEEL